MNNTLEIANTIKSQISPRILWGIAAQKFMALSSKEGRLGGLTFKASLFDRRKCEVFISLNCQDLYDVEVRRISGTLISKQSDVFAEDLGEMVSAMVEHHFKG